MGLFGRESQSNSPAQAQSMRNPSPVQSAASTTTIAEGSKVCGEISGSNDVRIEGEIHGSVSISGYAVVAESGKVRTSIRAARVVVSGQVDGDIFGDQMIELEPTAVVNGDLLAPKILIREGASLQGRVEMASPPQATSSPQVPKVKIKGKNQRGRKNSGAHTPAGSAGDPSKDSQS